MHFFPSIYNKFVFDMIRYYFSGTQQVCELLEKLADVADQQDTQHAGAASV